MEDSETTQIRSSRSRLPATALATTIPSTKVTIQISSVGHWQIPSTQFRSPATRRGPCDLRARAPSICWRGRLVRSWIRERSVGLCTRTRRKLRGVDLVAPHDVHYRNALRQQVVGNDTTMAAPPHSFSAHDRAALFTGQRSQLIQSRSECFSCSVIGIVSEGGHPPECIERWRRAFFPVPQTTKSRQMPISYPSTTQRFGESIGVELRIRPRARD